MGNRSRKTTHVLDLATKIVIVVITNLLLLKLTTTQVQKVIIDQCGQSIGINVVVGI